MSVLLKCLSLLWVLAASSWVNLANAADLIVVIDDVGYNKVRGLRAINLPGAVTIAVLPFAPHTAGLIKQAFNLDKNIIVHQPMEPHPSEHAREEHDTLKLHMSDDEFDTLVQRALDAVPMGTGLHGKPADTTPHTDVAINAALE
ncbi:MAG: divergent polysaccharide deacetylase family protein [Gammaproteobacteria bacterium]|nr:divergent polysaccharide deacetylase family protein [Gammaproteobacteria bacterium]